MSSKATKASSSPQEPWTIVYRAIMQTVERRISAALSILDEDESAGDAVHRICLAAAGKAQEALSLPHEGMHGTVDHAFDVDALLNGAEALCGDSGSLEFRRMLKTARTLLDSMLEIVETANFPTSTTGEVCQ
ncbi:hypothetical protein [Comamonas sp.]|uniref:hypothetical protein n=1 Tax=Comamonas sp. TaxID=34028 RepID=UPI003A911650